MKKNVLFLLTVFALVIAILISCGDETTDDGNNTGTGTGTGSTLSITVTNPPAEGAYADSYFTIKWTYTRKSVTFPRVSLYYDSDDKSGGQILIADNVPAITESLVWETYDLPDHSSYYILAVIDDSETCYVGRKPFDGKTSSFNNVSKNDSINQKTDKAQDYSDGTVTIIHAGK